MIDHNVDNKPDAIPADTSEDAAVMQLRVLRKMDTNARGEMALQLCQTVHQMLEDGVRARNPQFDDKAVQRTVVRLMIGDRLFKEVFPEQGGG